MIGGIMADKLIVRYQVYVCDTGYYLDVKHGDEPGDSENYLLFEVVDDFALAEEKDIYLFLQRMREKTRAEAFLRGINSKSITNLDS
ncbi:MAG: hypothetical protein Q8P20_03020 [bacterium]|nr:hypothetical protein [bacterium]